MAAKPFESKIQNLVYNVDVGIGLRLIKSGLYILFFLVVILIYTATQFHGLKDAEAMDYAQLARNLSTQHHFVTQCVRPASMWCLINKSGKHNPTVNNHPDILHPPVWPTLLAAAFKIVKPTFVVSKGGGVFTPEQWIIIPICHLFTLLTGIAVFLLAQRLFDRRTGFWSMTLFYLSDTAWGDSISGLNLSLATFLTTAAFYGALVAAARFEEEQPGKNWLTPLAVSLGLCVLAFLTRYGAIAVLPGVALFVAFSFKEKGWKLALGMILAFLIAISPWLVRNKVVSGGLLGLAPYTALNNSQTYDEDGFERALKPNVTLAKYVDDVKVKMMGNLKQYTAGPIRTLGDGLFICFFITALFYRFVRTPVHVFRWCVVASMVLLLLIASAFGDATIRLLHIFCPFVIIYGLAFFFILLDRLQLRVRLFNLAVTAVVIVLGALPLIFTMLPPRAGVPYPPYFPPFVSHVCAMLTPDEVICTDMPWATAWYGNRTSILLPTTIDEFYEINDYCKRISGLYFTTLTRNKPYVRSLLTGSYRTWLPILEGRIPADFPLTQGFPINNMDQIFLTDRIRWNQQSE